MTQDEKTFCISGPHPEYVYRPATNNRVTVVVQFGFWFNLDFPLFDIRYHILA